jgi:hypothetical protein
LGLQVLAHLRDNPMISESDCRGLAKKLRLRPGLWQKVCEIMWDWALLRESRAGGYRLLKRGQVFKRLPQ